MLENFYHNIIAKTLGAFGTLFNDIHYRKYDSNGNEISRLKVPIIYSDKQKFVSKLQQENQELQRTFETAFPKIGFQIRGLRYAADRKTQTTTKTFNISTSDDSSSWRYERVPYDLDLSLYVIAKNTEEFLQIIEQILPYFTPDYSITIRNFSDLDRRIDVPIIFTGMDLNENSDTFESRKTVEATLNFVAKVHLMGPIKNSKVIKEVDVSFHRYMPDGSYSATAGLTYATVRLEVSAGITPGSLGNTGSFTTQIFEYGA